MADNNNPIKYSDLVKPDNSIARLIKELEELKLSYSDTLETVKAEAITVKAALKDLSGATNENRDTIRKSATDADKLTKAQEKLKQSQSNVGIELKRLQQIQKEQNQLTNLEIKLNRSKEGSYNKLSAQYSINKIRLNNMSDSQRSATAEGRKLEEETKAIYEEMKKLQEATGKYSLNVGNYKNDILAALKEQQRLTDELEKTKKEFKNLPAVVKKNENAVVAYEKKITELRNGINDLGEVTGRTAADIEDVDYTEVFGDYDEKIKGLLGLNNQFGQSLLSLGKGGDGATSMFTSIGNGAKALGKTLLGLLANPVFLAIAGIAGVGLAFKFWYDYNKGLVEATRLTSQFTGKTGDDLKQFRNEVQAVADTFDKDFKETLMSANAVAKQFGISQDEALKLIKDGFVAGADANGEFLDNLKEYPAYFKEAGLSASQMIAITAQTNKSGIYSDKGIDTIKEGNLRIREMTTATAAALDGIGISSKQVLKDLQNGSKTTFDVMQEVSAKLGELPENSQAVGTAIADIFGGAGEDAGLQYIKTLKDIDTNLDTVKGKAGELGALQEEQLRSQAELNNVISALFDQTGGTFERMTTGAKVFINDGLVFMIKGIIDLINYFIKLYNDLILFRVIIQGIIADWKILWNTTKSLFTYMIDQLKVIGKALHGAFTLDFDEIQQAYVEWGENTLKLTKNIVDGTVKIVKDSTKDLNKKIEPITIPLTVGESDKKTTTKTGGGTQTPTTPKKVKSDKELENIRKKNLELVRKYEDAQTNLEANEFDKRRKQTLLNYSRQRQDLEYQLATDKELNKSGREALNGLLIALDEQLTMDLSDIERERQIQQIELQKQGIEERLKTVKEGSEQELELQNQLVEQERKLALLQNSQKPKDQQQDTGLINAGFDAQIKANKDFYSQQALAQFDAQQALAQSEFDLLKKTEAEKTKFKLEAEKERLQKILEINSKLNTQMGEAELQTIKNTIAKIDQEIQTVSDQPKDIYQMFGLSLDDDQKEAISGTTSFALDNLNQILAANVALTEIAVENAEKETTAAQSKLDSEIEARNRGYASNVSMAQKELDLAKKNQAKALKEQEKAQKQQAAIQTIQQIGNLVSATAMIWSQLGFPWAIPAIAVMWGSFAAAKIKANQVAKAQTESYGDGTVELLSGGSHQSGDDVDLGTKPDGTRRRAEGGEFFAVINKRSSRRFRHVIPDVIRSLNGGTFADKYLSAYETGNVNLSVNNNNTPDMQDLKSDVREIRNQNRRKYYTNGNGETVETYKNLRRTYKN